MAHRAAGETIAAVFLSWLATSVSAARANCFIVAMYCSWDQPHSPKSCSQLRTDSMVQRISVAARTVRCGASALSFLSVSTAASQPWRTACMRSVQAARASSSVPCKASRAYATPCIPDRKGVSWDKLLVGKTADVIVTSDTPPLLDALLYMKPARRVLKNQVLGFCGIKTRNVVQFSSVR